MACPRDEPGSARCSSSSLFLVSNCQQAGFTTLFGITSYWVSPRARCGLARLGWAGYRSMQGAQRRRVPKERRGHLRPQDVRSLRRRAYLRGPAVSRVVVAGERLTCGGWRSAALRDQEHHRDRAGRVPSPVLCWLASSTARHPPGRASAQGGPSSGAASLCFHAATVGTRRLRRPARRLDVGGARPSRLLLSRRGRVGAWLAGSTGRRGARLAGVKGRTHGRPHARGLPPRAHGGGVNDLPNGRRDARRALVRDKETSGQRRSARWPNHCRCRCEILRSNGSVTRTTVIRLPRVQLPMIAAQRLLVRSM